MALDDRTAQEQLTPEARRGLLRAFADRMLLKVTAMDDPEDMPGVEKAVRVAAVIERIYYRCDRAEHHAPEPYKVEAERAKNAEAAIKSRFSLANTLQWKDRVFPTLEPWIGAATEVVVAPAVTTSKPEVAKPKTQPEAPSLRSSAGCDDGLGDIQAARALLGLPYADPETFGGRDPPG